MAVDLEAEEEDDLALWAAATLPARHGGFTESDRRMVNQWRKWRETGDTRTYEAMVRHFMGLVRYVAGRQDRKDWYDEMVSVGNEAMLQSLANYNPDHGVPLKNYIGKGVYLRLRRFLSRETFRTANFAMSWRERVDTARNQLTKGLGRYPEDYELAASLNLDEASFRWRMQADDCARNVVALEDCRSRILELSSRRSLESEVVGSVFIEEMMQQLSARDQYILKAIVFEQRTMIEVGAAIGLSGQAVHQIYKNIKKKLRPSLRKQGFTERKIAK